MALLPQEILPPTQPIGRLNEEGAVTIDKNWWLFFLNISQQALPPAGSGGTPATASQALEMIDLDIATTDAIAARQVGIQSSVLSWLIP